MAISKSVRVLVHEKYGKHCAYCGCILEYKKMQVDHLYPQFLAHHYKNDKKKDIDEFGNLMPSCAKCNNHKHSWRLEEWRRELSLQVTRLLKTSTQFNKALLFGQVIITESPIVFYFEILQRNKEKECH